MKSVLSGVTVRCNSKDCMLSGVTVGVTVKSVCSKV